MEAAAELWHGALRGAATTIEILAALILAVGAARFIVGIAPALWPLRNSAHLEFRKARVLLGNYILAALEFLIVADILFTILRRTLEELYLLATLTAIRTVLSWFLIHEIRTLEDEKG